MIIKVFQLIGWLFYAALIHITMFDRDPNFVEHFSSSPEVIWRAIFVYMILYFFIFTLLGIFLQFIIFEAVSRVINEDRENGIMKEIIRKAVVEAILEARNK